jgi:1-acyl-sn-glycerol-3-phosphate acyltransferase
MAEVPAQWRDPGAMAEAARSLREEVRARLQRLEIPFNAVGIDPYGISRKHLEFFLGLLGFFHRYYFRVRTFGAENVPARGRAMLVGNHSGGVAVDAAMLITSAFFELDPPRLAQGMAEKFLARIPFAGQWTSRSGQFTGLPEHSLRLLEDDRLLMVSPEGARGTAKLYSERYSMVSFGTGFMRQALQTRTPIIPVGILGGGAAVPTIANLYGVGRMIGIPYLPVTPYLLPLPLPVRMEIHCGPPLHFEGTGDEEDHVIEGYVEVVKQRIASMIERRRKERWSLRRVQP